MTSTSGSGDGAAAPCPRDITQLLVRWRRGDESALGDLLPLIYDDLRVLATKYLSYERPDHSLQATELVHEAYLRLSRVAHLEAQDRRHFFAIAARAMRRILVDHARRHRTDKRGGARRDQLSEDPALPRGKSPEELIQVHEALVELQGRQPRPAQLVELRFFGGLSESEAADVLGISRSTAARDWRFARIWLTDHLRPE